MATKTLVIQPVTRIEGHAKVTIQLNDAGNVDTARVNVIELRGLRSSASDARWRTCHA